MLVHLKSFKLKVLESKGGLQERLLKRVKAFLGGLGLGHWGFLVLGWLKGCCVGKTTP